MAEQRRRLDQGFGHRKRALCRIELPRERATRVARQEVRIQLRALGLEELRA
jgi:hypothetical protein